MRKSSLIPLAITRCRKIIINNSFSKLSYSKNATFIKKIIIFFYIYTLKHLNFVWTQKFCYLNFKQAYRVMKWAMIYNSWLLIWFKMAATLLSFYCLLSNVLIEKFNLHWSRIGETHSRATMKYKCRNWKILLTRHQPCNIMIHYVIHIVSLIMLELQVLAKTVRISQCS